MKDCERHGCKLPRAYFNKALGLKICLICRMTYYSNQRFIKIPDDKLVTQAVETNSLWLEAILNYSNTFHIENLYKGFKEELSNFIVKNEDIKNRLKESEANDLIEDIISIEEEIFDLKNQIDSSEMMHNFIFHRFQVYKTN